MIKFDVAYNQYITSLRSITNYVSHEQMHTWLESHVHKLSGKQKQAAARKFEFESKAVFFFESDDLFRQ